jgi:hypothetical protein
MSDGTRSIDKGGSTVKALSIERLSKTAALSILMLALVTALFAVAAPAANADQSVEPQASALGKSLGEWFELWSIWNSPYGGGPDHHGNYRYMPLPSPDCSKPKHKTDPWYCVGELDVTLMHDQGFFLPVNGYVGWEYLDGSEDPLLDDSTFVDVDVSVTLDGDSFFDSDDLDLTTFYSEQYYGKPLYVDPDVEGYLADIFAQGVAFLCPPLSQGTHVLHLVEHAPAWNVIWDNTWNITVTAE